MANEEHLAKLLEGPEAWNRWRLEHADVAPDLREADLTGADLRDTNLSRRWGQAVSNPNYLRKTDARRHGVDLRHIPEVDPTAIDLLASNLNGAKLYWADLRRADLRYAELRTADLSHADLSEANLGHADLGQADLRWSNLTFTKLIGANLNRANLNIATLGFTNLVGADLSEANLTSAYLHGADLREANLHGADLHDGRLNGTGFGATDLSEAKGLDTCQHRGPSILDHRTILKSSPLPLAFLRGCGLPDVLIDYLRSLLNQPIQYYSCFISHSTKDQEFAERLHADLDNKGVRNWYAPEDLKIGDPFRQRIDDEMRLHQKLLVILSEHS